jgi:2-oxoglutarate dehydrogenase E2 component (dihydrolipoamide succinyltransferase)
MEIVVPNVGESITEVFIGEWYVGEGGQVEADGDVVGLETDKATFDVPAPATGTVTKVLKQAGETAQVGEVIAHLEPGEISKPSDGSDAAPEAAPAPAPQEAKPAGMT